MMKFEGRYRQKYMLIVLRSVVINKLPENVNLVPKHVVVVT